MSEKITSKDLFNARMRVVETLSDLVDKSDERKEKRVEVREKAQKTLRKIAYDYGVAVGGIDTNAVPNPEALDQTASQEYLGMVEDQNSTEATQVLAGDLEGILAEVDSSKLAPLASAEEFRKAAGQGWNKLADLYSANNAYKSLVGKAKRKDLTGKEEDMLTNRALAIYQEEQTKFYSKGQFKGNAFLAKAAARAATALLKAGQSKDSIDNYLIKAAESLLGESEASIKAHEKEKGQNIQAYVASAIRNLIKGSTDEANLARNQLYAVTK